MGPEVSIKIKDELFNLSYETLHDLDQDEAHGLLELVEMFLEEKAPLSREVGGIVISFKSREFKQKTVMHYIPSRKDAVELLWRVAKFLDPEEPVTGH